MLSGFSSFVQEIGGRFFLAAVPPAFVLVVGETVLFQLLIDPGAEVVAFLPLFENLLNRPAFWTIVVFTALGLLLANRLLVQTWEGYWWLSIGGPSLQAASRRLLRRPSARQGVTAKPRAEEIGGDLQRLLHERRDAVGEAFPLRLALAHAWSDGEVQPPFVPTLPTELGRILQTMEATPALRYRIEGIGAWSRILLVVPAALAQQYRVSRIWLDLALHLASAMVLLAASDMLLLRPKSVAGWSVVAVLVLAGYLLYRLSLPFAWGMRLAYEAAFDLYRGDLLKAWGLRQPRSLSDEQSLWWMITQFQYWGSPYLFPDEYRLDERPAPESIEQKGLLARLRLMFFGN